MKTFGTDQIEECEEFAHQTASTVWDDNGVLTVTEKDSERSELRSRGAGEFYNFGKAMSGPLDLLDLRAGSNRARLVRLYGEGGLA